MLHPRLKKIRESKDLSLRPTQHLKTTFTGFDGQEYPLRIRYYQVQGILHLVVSPRFLLGDDTGLGKCVTKDTLILTDRGLVEIGSLGPEGTLEPDTFYPLVKPIKVWTGWRWAPVKSFFSSGRKPTRRIRTRRGYEITGTFVHPLWMRTPSGEGFHQTRELSLGDFVCIDRSGSSFPTVEPLVPHPLGLHPNTRSYAVPERLTPDLAALLGYVVAEGWTASRLGFHVTQHRDLNPEVHRHIRELCEKVLGWVGNEDAENKDTTINVSSVFLREYLTGLGVGPDLSATKSVPWPVLQGTRKSILSFIRAFFDGEGSVTGSVLEVSSASERLLREIQVLLLRLGITCTRSPKTVKGREQVYWKLTLCGDDARLFAKYIGFLTPRKAQALAVLCEGGSNPNLDVVPCARGLIRALQLELVKATTKTGSNGNRKGSGIRQFGVSFEKTLNNIKNRGRNPTYPFLSKLHCIALEAGLGDTPELAALGSVLDNHFFYDPVVEICEGENEVVDIEVDDLDHSFVSNGMISHNTIQAIAALCYLWEKEPNAKALILTTKSATRQWAGEFEKFTTGVRVIVCKGTQKQRSDAHRAFEQSIGPTVIIMGYRAAVQDYSTIQSWQGHIFIADEATAFKNPKTQVHQVCQHISRASSRTWALTATLIKNNLMEGHGIYRIVEPDLRLSKMSPQSFMMYYCIVRMQRIPKSNRQIPVVVGYHPLKIQEFKEEIEHVFLGRPKHDVASELPALVSKIIEVGLSPAQQEKYNEALDGLDQHGVSSLVVGEKRPLGQEEIKEVTKLTSIIYLQEIVNHLGLIDCEGDSEKLDALFDLLEEGDLAEEKVIVFTRFKKMVDILMPAFQKAKIKAVRVTGDEDEDARSKAMEAFQDPDGDTRVICITMAGSDAINLQAAKAIVFFDTPWSAGDFIQIVGRMIRIGSTHDRCYAIHLVAKGQKDTVDHRVLEVMNKKMHLIEAVIGRRIKGEGDIGAIIPIQNDISDLFDLIQQDARGRRT